MFLPMSNVLMLSNSTMPGTEFFTWPQTFMKKFLKGESRNLRFIPYAAVTLSFDEYEEKVKAVFAEMNFTIESIHRSNDKIRAITDCDGIVIGGGNTFALLSRIYEHDLLDIIRQKVLAGTLFIGWSAGANLACPTIMTTNDMPIVQPKSFEALNLVPFQINPHYHELKFEGQGGETRKERLEEFIAMGPDRTVIGLPEGTGILKESKTLTLIGEGTAKLYRSNKPMLDINPGSDLSFLLR
jgi:dipeptidase E